MWTGSTTVRSTPDHATVVHAVHTHALRDRPGTIGVVDDEELRYREFWRRVAASTQRLRELGVRPGDRVGLTMSTRTAVLCTTLGILACGATLVPLRPVGRLRGDGRDGRKFLDSLRLTQTRWCVVNERQTYQPLLDTAGLKTVLLDLDDVGAARPQYDFSTGDDLPVELDPEQTALIQFSSGTTGAPKGIVLTHGNLAANLGALTSHTDLRHHTVSWLPLDHDMGLVGTFLGSLHGGAALRLLAPSTFVRDPLSLVIELSNVRATHTSGPPLGYAQAAARARQARHRLAGCDLSALRVAVVGAERITAQLYREFENTFAPHGLRPNTMLPAYGLAENCVIAACRSPRTPTTIRTVDRAALTDGTLRETASTSGVDLVGHGGAVPGTMLRITGADGQPLPERVVGEIHIGGAATTRRCIDENGALVPTHHDGWVRTGDIGAFYDNELYVVGRIKEIFKHGGQAFALTEVEQTVTAASIPGLHAVAAVAVCGPNVSRESLVLCLELNPRTCPSEVATACRLGVLQKLGLPIDDVFAGRRGALPRTTSGKIQRQQLLDAYPGDSDDQLMSFRRVHDRPEGSPSTGRRRVTATVKQ